MINLRKDILIALAYTAITMLGATAGMLSLIWQAQNPKANKMTFYTHFDDVIHLRKLEKFQ